MPVRDGFYEQLTEDEIRSALEAELQVEFGQNIDLTESSVFSTLTNVLATVLADNQEQSLQDVYESAFLDTADGEALNDVVSIIGLARRAVVHATGVERFIASGPVTQDYTIQGGTVVQTDGDTPIEFETSEPTILQLIDSFEDGDITEYSGDTGNATVVADVDAPQGNNAIELDATDGAHIYNDNFEIKRGTVFHAWLNPEQANTAPAVTFGVQPADIDTYYQVVADHATDEVRLEYVLNGVVDTIIDTLPTAGLTTDAYHEVEISWATTAALGVEVFDPSGNSLGTLGGTDDTLITGYCGFKSEDASGTKRIDWYTTSEVSANIRAAVGSTNGNVGAESITALPSPPSGVSEVTNLYPTGDNTYSDTDNTQFVLGQNEESDSELRNRAEDAVTGGGAATHDAIVSALINETPGVSSATIFENKTEVDNTGTGGLPPHSFEAVVFGGTDENVAETIFDKKAVTARDYSGVNGTAVTETVKSRVNGQTRSIEFSRPAEVSIDLSLDIVVDDAYVGDEELRDDITSYIGGVLSDGDDVVGLGVAEDVLIDQIRDIVVGDDTGVIGFDSSVDGTPISSTPAITTVDGLDVIDIGANEVAQTDATDASITLNTREL